MWQDLEVVYLKEPGEVVSINVYIQRKIKYKTIKTNDFNYTLLTLKLESGLPYIKNFLEVNLKGMKLLCRRLDHNETLLKQF